MNIQELEYKHKEIIGESDLNFPDWLIPGEDTNALYKKEEKLVAKEATKLSVEFAIETIEELQKIGGDKDFNHVAWFNLLGYKIQELKKYLDNNISDDK